MEAMIVAILGSRTGLLQTLTEEELLDLEERWSLDESLSCPVDGFGWDALDNNLEGLVEKALYLMPPGDWDPSLAIAVAETVVAWAAEEGHSLVLIGQSVADAFTWPDSQELGSALDIEASRTEIVPCFGMPDITSEELDESVFREFNKFIERN